MALKELLEALASMDGAERPETMFDDIGTAYDDDVAGYGEAAGSADAMIAQLSETLKTNEAEMTRVKAHNYELLQLVGNAGDSKSDEPVIDAEPTDDVGYDRYITEEED